MQRVGTLFKWDIFTGVGVCDLEVFLIDREFGAEAEGHGTPTDPIPSFREDVAAFLKMVIFVGV